MKGYLNNDRATAEIFTGDGWLRTGDIGRVDENGFFYVVDRLKELIKYKGYQVPPAELETVLVSHPKVKDVGVIGVPMEGRGGAEGLRGLRRGPRPRRARGVCHRSGRPVQKATGD